MLSFMGPHYKQSNIFLGLLGLLFCCCCFVFVFKLPVWENWYGGSQTPQNPLAKQLCECSYRGAAMGAKECVQQSLKETDHNWENDPQLSRWAGAQALVACVMGTFSEGMAAGSEVRHLFHYKLMVFHLVSFWSEKWASPVITTWRHFPE